MALLNRWKAAFQMECINTTWPVTATGNDGESTCKTCLLKPVDGHYLSLNTPAKRLPMEHTEKTGVG